MMKVNKHNKNIGVQGGGDKSKGADMSIKDSCNVGVEGNKAPQLKGVPTKRIGKDPKRG